MTVRIAASLQYSTPACPLLLRALWERYHLLELTGLYLLIQYHDAAVPSRTCSKKARLAAKVVLPSEERTQLRLKDYNGQEAHLDDFRLSGKERDDMMESCMAAFTKLEDKLLRRAQFQHYENRGRLACSDLFNRTSQENSNSDLVFVAIDFEGDVCRKGITELGLARLDMQELEKGIQGTNIATARRSRRKYLFQKYMRVDIAQLPDAIVSSLSGGRIVLVGHSIQSELKTMQDLGVDIDSLPDVVGSECFLFTDARMHR